MTKPDPSIPFAVQRRTMVDCQLRTYSITDQALLARFLAVPRERFLPADLVELAYSDMALRVGQGSGNGQGRSLLPPLVLGRMMQGAALRPGDRVLDVAAATGYSAAILSGLVASVTVLDCDGALVDATRQDLDAYGLPHVVTACGPLHEGHAPAGPYDVVFVNGGVEANLESLLSQLAPDGRLIAIEYVTGGFGGRIGKAVRIEKRGDVTGSRILFDASAPVLADFRRAAAFAF